MKSLVWITTVILVAVLAVCANQATWFEAGGFISGAACVWLTVRQNIWNYPIGLVNVSCFGFVFYQSRLFADAFLQVVYFALGVQGWYLWLYGGKNRSQLKITHATWQEKIGGLLAVIAMTSILWHFLGYLGGSASFWDALTTAMSLVAQWLLNHKRLESWIGWIVVDIVYVPLYIYKELYLTALLYSAFLVMATIGLHTWYCSYKAQSSEGLQS